MKKFRLTLLLVMLSISCFGQSPIESPCNDSLYVSLKTKAIGQMTDREFAYFNQKEKDCTEKKEIIHLQKHETLLKEKSTLV
jgi:hypothetical protein